MIFFKAQEIVNFPQKKCFFYDFRLKYTKKQKLVPFFHNMIDMVLKWATALTMSLAR